MDLQHTEAVQAHGPAWPRRLLMALIALLGGIKVRRRGRELQLCETLSLGEKRALIIVRCGTQRLLIGATSQSISLIDRLETAAAGPGCELGLRQSFVNGDTSEF